jgi:hypothetical protein
VTVAQNRSYKGQKINFLLFGQSGFLESCENHAKLDVYLSSCQQGTNRQCRIDKHADRILEIILSTFQLLGRFSDICPI